MPVTPLIGYAPEPTSEPVMIRLTPTAREQLRKLAYARREPAAVLARRLVEQGLRRNKTAIERLDP